MVRFRMTGIARIYRRASSWLGEDQSVRTSVGAFAVMGVAAVVVCLMTFLGNVPVPFLAPWFILFGILAALVALIALVRDRNRHLMQARENSALANIGRVISLSPDFGDVFERFAAEVKKLVSFDRIVIVLVNIESGMATFRYQHGQAVGGHEGGYAYPLEGREVQRIVTEGKSSIRADISDNPEFGVDKALLEAGLRSSARVPLIANGRVIGTLNLHSFQVGTYGTREQILLEHLANQIAPTIENTHLYEQTGTAEKQAQERSNELSVLVDIASILTEPGDFLGKAEGVMEQLAQVADVEWATIRLPDMDGNLVLLVAAGSAIHISSPVPLLSDRDHLAFTAFQESKTIVANEDLGIINQWASPALQDLGAGSLAFLPIKSQDRTLGLISFVSRQINHFTPELVRLLTAVAEGLGGFLENARLSQELHATTEEMAVVDEVARIITSTLEVETVYDQFAGEVKKLVGFDRAILNVIDQANDTVIFKYAAGLEGLNGRTGAVFPLHGSVAEHLIQSHESIVQSNLPDSVLFGDIDQHRIDAGIQSSMAVPLISSNRVVAALTFLSRSRDAYGTRERRIVERLASQIAPAIENSELYGQTKSAEKRALERSDELSVLVDIASELSEPGDFLEKATGVMERLAIVADVEWATLRLPNQDGDLALVVAAGSAIHSSPPRTVLTDRENVAYIAYHESRPIVVNDYPAETDRPASSPGFELGTPSPSFLKLGMKSMVLLPIRSGAQTLGLINLVSNKINHFTPELVKLMTAVADGVGALLDNARLSQELQASTEEMAVVEEIARVMTSTLDIDQVYEQFAAEVRKLVEFDRIAVNVVDHLEGTYIVKYNAGLEIPGIPLGVKRPLEGTLTEQLILTHQTVVRPDLSNTTHYSGTDQHSIKLGLQSGIVLPMISNGRVVSILSLLSRSLDTYGSREQRILERLASQIAPAIENAALYQDARLAQEEQQRLAEENRVVAEIGRIISSSLDITEVYDRVGQEIRELIPFDRMILSLIDRERSVVSPAWISGADFPDRQRGAQVPLAGSIAEMALQKRSPFMLEAGTEQDLIDLVPSLLPFFQAGMRSFLAVALSHRDDVVAVLQLQSTELGIFSQVHLELAERIGNQIAGAVANAQLYEAQKLSEDEERRAAVENKAMAEIGRIVSSSLDIDEVYQRLSEEVQKLIPFDRLSVTMIDLTQDIGLPTYIAGTDVPGRRKGDVFPLAGTLAGATAHSRSGMKLEAGCEADLFPVFPGLLLPFRAGLRSFIAIPLINRQSVIGVMQIRSEQIGIYSDHHLDLAERIGNQIAGAIENAQLYEAQRRADEEERRAAKENRVMAEIGRIISSSLDIADVYERLAEEVRSLIPFDRMGLSVVDEIEETSTPTWVTGLAIKGRRPGDVIPFAGSIAGEACLSKSSIMLDAAKKEDLNQRFPALMPSFRSGLRSFIAVPLVHHDVVLGVLQIRSKTPGIYVQRHLNLAERIGAQIAGAISNAQLYEQTRQAEEAEHQRSEELAGLLQVSNILNQQGSFQNKVSLVMAELSRICGADASANFRVPTEDGLMLIGFVGEPSTTGLLGYQGNIAALAYEQREILVANDYPNHPLALEENIQRGLKSALAVPVFSQESVVGVVIVSTLEPNYFTPERVSLLMGIINGLGSLLETARLEDQHLQAEQELLESERRFRQISENMGQVVFLVNHQNNKFLYVNEAFEMIWGQPRESLYENSNCWFDALHPADRDLVESALGIQRHTGEFEAEYRVIRPDGTTRWIFDRTFPIQDEAGKVYRLVGIAEDITERKQNEERMHETSRLASIGELAAGVAHEINNPLTSVLGFSQLLLGEDLPERAHGDIQRILSEAQRAAKIVQNLLSFARKHPNEARYIPIGPIMERVLELKAYDFRLHDIEADIAIPDNLPETMVDEYQLIQVLLNLLNNGEHAVQQVPEQGAISLRVIQERDRLRISVADNGPGIPQEHLGRIFEPFFTTKEVGVGTGLGLSTCYGIVRQHGGKMWVENGEQGGATFFFELPVVGPAAGVEQETSESIPGPRTTKHLLVVDDEPGIRDLLRRALELAPYTVDLAEDGEQAWDKICQRNYDCIIMDLKMPGMSGPELFHEIEGMGEAEAARVIFITGDTVSSDTSAFVGSVNNPVLNKPLDVQCLRSEIQKIVEVTA